MQYYFKHLRYGGERVGDKVVEGGEEEVDGGGAVGEDEPLEGRLQNDENVVDQR